MDQTNIRKLAFSATLHCLTGCAIGEVLGMVIGVALGLETLMTVALAVVLAFGFGYSFSLIPLVRQGMRLLTAARLVLAADTLSIATMEVVDNLVMVAIPQAMEAGLTSAFFWFSLMLALIAAFIVAYPVNLILLRRGQGHALIHDAHHH